MLAGFVTSFVTAAVELSATIMLVTKDSQAPMSYGIYLYMQSAAGRGPGAALGVLAVAAVAIGTGIRMKKVSVECRNIRLSYGKTEVLKDVNINIEPGEFFALLGPSGSGKSTMIRCINRLEEHQKGHIIVDGTELTNDLKHIETIRKDVGMVFQHFNLFPHLTVLENLTLGPMWVLKKPRAEAEATAMKYLERVRIPEQAKKFPGQLSGGQQQRVAIARSLCMNPKIMLFDEPTTAA
ncbi:hypothetical protein G6F57_018229 [Rhizopus arrhizus]|nr:hypothetical protein G6F57_018229 [Rhizopus arrhizus]